MRLLLYQLVVCGLYKSQCHTHEVNDKVEAEYYNATFIGERYRDPTKMIYSHYFFDDNDCSPQSDWVYTVTNIFSPIHMGNDAYKVKYTNTTFSLTEYGLEKYHCEPAIKPNTFYPLQYSFEYFY